jgi:hypothetical protein
MFSQDANTSICARSAMDSRSASCLALHTYPVASREHGGRAARRDLGAITAHARAEAEVKTEYPGIDGRGSQSPNTIATVVNWPSTIAYDANAAEFAGQARSSLTLNTRPSAHGA